MSDEMNNVGATPATGPSTGSQDAPLLIFSDEAGNQINEISLAPGEQKKITVVLSDHPEGITQNFLAQWSVYDSNHQLTSGITCVMDADSKKWLNPLCLSTTDESVGGMSGNDLISARMGNGVWRCMGKNPNGQFWYPRDMYIPPVPVAEFVLMASSDWTDKYATFELDNNVTKFVLTSETGTPAANGTTVTCNYSMKLTVNNTNASNVTPPQENNDGQVTPPPQENGGEATPTPTPPQENNGGTTPPPQNNEPFPNFPNSSTPKLVFGDEAGKPIKEISLAPGEERTIQVILYQHPEVITQAFQADWNMYDSNHEPTTGVTCKKEGNGWIYPLGLSTYSKAEGGMSGNMLQSAKIDISTWRCIGMNSMTNQLWYPRDQFTTPVPVAEFTVMAANDWTDKFVTFELDPNATQFVLASDTAVPTNKRTVAQCDYDMVLTIKNTDPNAVSPAPKENHNDDTTPPSQVDNAPDEPITTFEGKPLVSKVKLDITIKTTGINQKTLKAKFIFNTFRLKKDANGKFVKEQGRTHVIDEQLYYCYSPSNPNKIQHDIRSLPLEEGEYLEDASIAMLSYYRLTGVTNWKKCSFTPSNGLLDASSGEIDLIFDGVIFTNKGAYLSKNSPSQIIGELPASIAEEENKRREEENKRREEQARKAKEEEERKKKEEEERKKKEEEERKKKEEEEAKNKEANRRKAIRDGLRSTSVDPKMVLYNDTLYKDNDPGINFVVSAGECYQLKNEVKTINKRTIYVKGGGFHNIYPGAIVIADKRLSEGSPIPLANVARSQTQIFGTFFSGKNTLKTVDASSAGNVHNIISEMLRELFGSQYQPAGTVDFNSKIYTSKSDMMVNMGVDASFCGSNVKVNATINNNESTFIQDTGLEQSFFTVRLNDNYRDDVSKLFGDKETWDNIKEQCTINGKVQPLAIITSVTYGRSVHFLKEFSTKSFHYEGDQSHTGHGVDLNSKQDIAKKCEATNVQLISLGDAGAAGMILTDSGPDDKALKAMSDDRIRQALEQTSKFGTANQGVPLSYTIELISGEAPGTPIAPVFDGQIIESTYKRCPGSVQVYITNKAYCTASEDNVRVSIGFMDCRIKKDERTGKYIKERGGHKTWQKTFKQSNNAQISSLPLFEGEYLDMEYYPTLTIESRGTNVGILSKKWKINVDNIPFDASSGVINLIIDGNTLKKDVHISKDSKTTPLGWSDPTSGS